LDPKFIVVEGIDGAGTTTCSKLLAQAMNDRGIEAMWTKEPSEGTVGRHIRRVLKGEETADEMGMFPLFLADRHDHIAAVIRPELQQGVTVVCDRYAYSTWVYQQDNYEPFVIEYLQRRCEVPDFVFVLTCPVEIAQERIRLRGGPAERYDASQKQVVYAKRYGWIPRIGQERIEHINTAELQPSEVVVAMMGHMGIFE
jgi:dTMP kinase